MSDGSMERLLTARVTPPSSPVSLRAGDLQVFLVDGDLRYMAASGTEVVRRVYVAVRDLDWNTLPGEIENLGIKDSGNSFEVTFSCRHRFGTLDYRWLATVTGDEAGRIRYEMSGEALSRFSYAKIGICIHHPVKGFAGMPYTGMSPTGPVVGSLPDTIGPQVHLADGTDVPLFNPVSELRLRHSRGGSVSFKFTGDLWEMEDHRNWTDQSFKSASTPASLGYVHEAELGQRFRQAVAIDAVGFPPVVHRAFSSVQVGQASNRVVPRIGVSCAEPAEILSPAARELFTLLRPAHLRFAVDLEGNLASLAAAAQLASELSTQLELAAFVPEGTGRTQATVRLREAVGKIRPFVARVLVFSKDAESTSPEVAVQSVEELRLLPDVPVLVGSDANFNELNRNRPGPGPASGLVWAATPQVHASDELSLVENLEAQAETVETARSFAPGLTLHISPITLRPRFNAVATTGKEFRPGGLPWNVDARQASLFAAAWTLGSAAILAAAGVDTLTYYELVGPRGLIESPSGSAYPQQFPSSPDTAYPLALVLADLCSLRGAAVLQVSGFDPLTLAALACVTSQGRTLLIANLTRDEARLEIIGLGESCSLRVLDSSNVGTATARPREFLGSADAGVGSAGTIQLHLGPYACARLDSSSLERAVVDRGPVSARSVKVEDDARKGAARPQ
ncbi:MAG: hypothetical protein ABSD85_15420 [Acidimicrobiales bacterium]